MTSFAFILGVVPLVVASGAGANAQKSIGIAVLTGMLGSTLLTVVFVPSVRRHAAPRGVAGAACEGGGADGVVT